MKTGAANERETIDAQVIRDDPGVVLPHSGPRPVAVIAQVSGTADRDVCNPLRMGAFRARSAGAEIPSRQRPV